MCVAPLAGRWRLARARSSTEQFAAEAADGRIQWRAIDYQSPGNEHWLADFHLLTGGVVLVQLRDGRPRRWTGRSRKHGT